MKRHKNYIMLFPFILIFSLIACSQKPATSPIAGEKPATIEKPAIKEGWEVEWGHVKEEAKKEGTLSLYSNLSSESRGFLAEGLKEYGIKLEAVSGRGADLVEKILRERKAGIYAVDLYLSGFGDMKLLKAIEALVPIEPLLILPEVKDPKMWYRGELPFATKDKTVLAYSAFLSGAIQINTDRVKPGDINYSEDLLSPKWQGNIIIDDPTIAGSGNQWISVVAKIKGEEYLKQLAKQNPILTRDRRLLIDWLAKGKVAVSIGIYTDMFFDYKRGGAPVDNLILRDVLYLTAGGDYITYFNRAPHPNVSRVFLNWLLSEKVQISWENYRAQQSARLGSRGEERKKMGLPVRQPGESYVDTIAEEWDAERVRKSEIIKEIFGPLVR